MAFLRRQADRLLAQGLDLLFMLDSRCLEYTDGFCTILVMYFLSICFDFVKYSVIIWMVRRSRS